MKRDSEYVRGIKAAAPLWATYPPGTRARVAAAIAAPPAPPPEPAAQTHDAAAQERAGLDRLLAALPRETVNAVLATGVRVTAEPAAVAVEPAAQGSVWVLFFSESNGGTVINALPHNDGNPRRVEYVPASRLAAAEQARDERSTTPLATSRRR